MSELFEKVKEGAVKTEGGAVATKGELGPEAKETAVMALEEVPRLPALSAKEFELAICEAEKKVALIPRFFGVLAKIAYTGDWTQFGDKGWLGGAGAERVALALGIQIDFDPFEQPPKEMCQDDQGDFYRYKRVARVSYMGRSMLAEGYSSTRKKFYGYTSAKGWRPLSEINEEYIIADAKTSCIQEGVTRLLGLRNIPVEELNKYKIQLKRAQEVPFKSGKSKSKPYNPNDLGQNSGLVSEAAQKVVENTLEINEVNRDEFLAYLKKTHKFEGIDQITEDKFNQILSWIKEQGKGKKGGGK